MNIEEVMAKILNWARFGFYMRPNDLEEGLLLIIIPKAILLNPIGVRIDNYGLKSLKLNKITHFQNPCFMRSGIYSDLILVSHNIYPNFLWLDRS